MDLFNQYKALVNGVKLITLVGLITVDTLLGVFLAVKSKTFAWSKLAGFLDTNVLTMAGGYFIVGLFALFEPSVRVIVPITWLALDAKLVADIVNKLHALGIPIPGMAKAKS